MYHACLLLYISSYSISAAHHSLVFLPAPCYAPAICNVKRYRARPWMILLLPGGCVRGEAAPVPTAAPRCWVYCVVATSRVSPVYRSSARSPPRPACVFPGRATEAVEAAHVSVHPPNLKEDGKSPQSCPSPDLQENPCYCNNPPPLTISSTQFASLSPFSAFSPTSSHVGCHFIVFGRGGDSAVPASASVLPCAHCHRPRFCAGRVLSAAAGSFQQACT